MIQVGNSGRETCQRRNMAFCGRRCSRSRSCFSAKVVRRVVCEHVAVGVTLATNVGDGSSIEHRKTLPKWISHQSCYAANWACGLETLRSSRHNATAPLQATNSPNCFYSWKHKLRSASFSGSATVWANCGSCPVHHLTQHICGKYGRRTFVSPGGAPVPKRTSPWELAGSAPFVRTLCFDIWRYIITDDSLVESLMV